MAFSLYDATVTNYLQILGAVGGFLDKSLTHFRDKGIDPAEIVEARLAPDMAPLRFQIVSVAHHSRGAIERALPFTAEGFLMSFSLPNFFFHATTAYDILRHKGAPLGKRDFMGRLTLKA